MTASAGRVFRALASEAVRDGVRRRIVPVIAAVSLLSLMLVDSCTSCAAPTVVQNGAPVALPDVSGWTGLVIYGVLGLWVMVLAGVLASDHLTEPLADGSATLLLARPVGRPTFALSRLAGVLAISAAAGAVLLGGTAALLVARNGVAVGAALWSALACALGATSVAALAMTASLFLPRVATVLLVLVAVGAIAGINAVSLSGSELGGAALVIDRFGPPLGSAVVAPLSQWIAPVALRFEPLAVAVRSIAWAVAAVSLLVVVFRRGDVPG